MPCQPAISTISLGVWALWHPHEACFNFKAIEFPYDDFDALARPKSAQPTGDDLLMAAREIRAICDSLQIHVLNFPSVAGGRNGPQAEGNLHQSLHRLASRVNLEKLIIVQMADAEKLPKALKPGHAFYVPGQPSRMSWSRAARLFSCEEDRGGYLPVLDVLRTVVNMGWSGWLAYEVFSWTLAGPEFNTPELHAERASQSWSKVAAFLIKIRTKHKKALKDAAIKYREC